MPRRRFSGFVLSIVLIALGVVLLLNTLEILPWNVWSTLARLWPVLVIAFGASVLWRHARSG